VTFSPEIVRTLTLSDSKCEMSSEYASSVPKCFVNLCEGRPCGKGESIDRDYLWVHESVAKIQVESMDAI
jgi:hypothetical protein